MLPALDEQTTYDGIEIRFKAQQGEDLSVKVVAAINDMNRRGHNARLYKHEGKVWVEIDQCMLASFDEIEELVDGVRSFPEQADLFKKRYAQELGRL